MPGKVLLIDDDPDLLPMMTAAFKTHGFDTVSARDGREGMKLFHSEQPDLVITDIVMPEQEGIATIIQIKRDTRPAKVIAISGGGRSGKGDFLVWAKELGADEVLRKPFRMSELVAAARRLIEN